MSGELLHFYYGGESWRFVNARRDVTTLGYVWTAHNFKLQRWRRNLSETEVRLETTYNVYPFRYFTHTIGPADVWVKILDSTGTVLYTGNITTIESKGTADACVVTTTPMSRLLQGTLPTRRYSASCPYNLGETLCGVDIESYKLTANIADSTVSGLTIEHADIGNNGDAYYTGGYIRNGFEYRYIVDQTGDIITLSLAFSLLNDPQFVIYPGCDKTQDTCENTFSNLANYGGFTNVPDHNPVTGYIV